MFGRGAHNKGKGVNHIRTHIPPSRATLPAALQRSKCRECHATATAHEA